VPADIILINTDSGSAFFDTVSLDGETILSERYAVNNKHVGQLQIQNYRGMLMCEEPNPIIHRFKGLLSENNSPFLEVQDRNFAMRGSVLRNTNFVMGIVVYVGNDTKAHQNAKLMQRK